VQATGFVEHLKLPHYVDFQAELVLVRRLAREFRERHGTADGPPDGATTITGTDTDAATAAAPAAVPAGAGARA
jgi:alpha-D-ribose 1-methylphosphonate 5-triphosphate synthase subunit PhnI